MDRFFTWAGGGGGGGDASGGSGGGGGHDPGIKMGEDTIFAAEAAAAETAAADSATDLAAIATRRAAAAAAAAGGGGDAEVEAIATRSEWSEAENDRAPDAADPDPDLDTVTASSLAKGRLSPTAPACSSLAEELRREFMTLDEKEPTMTCETQTNSDASGSPDTSFESDDLNLSGRCYVDDDVESKQEQEQEKEQEQEQQHHSVTLTVPPGRLGLEIDVDPTNFNVPTVMSILPNSIVSDQFRPGDQLQSIEGRNVANCTPTEVAEILNESKRRGGRSIRVLRAGPPAPAELPEPQPVEPQPAEPAADADKGGEGGRAATSAASSPVGAAASVRVDRDRDILVVEEEKKEDGLDAAAAAAVLACAVPTTTTTAEELMENGEYACKEESGSSCDDFAKEEEKKSKDAAVSATAAGRKPWRCRRFCCIRSKSLLFVSFGATLVVVGVAIYIAITLLGPRTDQQRANDASLEGSAGSAGSGFDGSGFDGSGVGSDAETGAGSNSGLGSVPSSSPVGVQVSIVSSGAPSVIVDLQTTIPTAVPTTVPTAIPLARPTSEAPTEAPTFASTQYPTSQLTATTSTPSELPTLLSGSLTPEPSASPTTEPTTDSPTTFPTTRSSLKPTTAPTMAQTTAALTALAPPDAPNDYSSSSASVKYPTFSFFVMGDGPYEKFEEGILTTQIEQLDFHNVANDDGSDENGSKFVVHVGDIMKGGNFAVCQQSRYDFIEQTFVNNSAMPSLMLPGDNDWLECPNRNQGWLKWLNSFKSLQDNWYGATSSPSSRFIAARVERDAVRQENFAFDYGGILFVGLHVLKREKLVGQKRIAVDAILLECARWLREQIASHNFRSGGATQEKYIRAIIIFGHALLRPFFMDVRAVLESTGVPVLYIHGNGHSYKVTNFDHIGWNNFWAVQVDQVAIAPPLKVTVRGTSDTSLADIQIPSVSADDSNSSHLFGDLIFTDRQGGTLNGPLFG